MRRSWKNWMNWTTGIALAMAVASLPCLAAAAGGMSQAEALPAEETAIVRLGRFELSRTLTQVLGASGANSVGAIFPPERPVSWEIFVPPGYAADKPPGLLVYISPIQSGRLPQGWEGVLQKHNLIWASANQSGNQVAVQRRALFAVIAPTLVEQDYVIDRERVYVTGMSGGGKMASMVATDHAHIFKGAIYNCGVEFWDVEPRRLEAVKANRYVFVTGEYDQALRPTKRAHSRYRKAGVTQVKLMVIDGMGHENPPPREFEEAIEFLDD